VSTQLRSTIEQLAQRFTEGILQAIRSASLEDLRIAATASGAASGNGGRVRAAESAVVGRARRTETGRLARRSPLEIEEVVDSIVALVKQNKAGLRAEQIRVMLKLDKKEIGRPIAAALQAKRLTKKGEKRATTYYAR
jgi:hypothetical protein